jgi:hypothetical protein
MEILEEAEIFPVVDVPFRSAYKRFLSGSPEARSSKQNVRRLQWTGLGESEMVVARRSVTALALASEAGGRRLAGSSLVGLSAVVVDQAAANPVTTTTLTRDVYAFPFGQKA